MRDLLIRVLVLVAALIAAQSHAGGNWRALDADGLHDPTNPAMGILQDPEDALSLLPYDGAGNQVDWARALRDGYIKPRGALQGPGSGRILESEVIMRNTKEMPMVRFPHRTHTEWLDCGNCHDQMFSTTVGGTPLNMLSILQGQYCGVCHGAVSFPLTECNRCHSVPHADMAQPLPVR